MKYRKKQIVIEAFRCGDLLIACDKQWESLPRKIKDSYEDGKLVFTYSTLSIKTPEGRMTAEIDDIIIIGTKGEIYPCKPDIFEATYEKVE